MRQRLDALIEKIERRRVSKNPDDISARVKRTVHKRDRGRCTYAADSGKRCDEKGDLNYDHIITRADGGDASPPNLRLRCHAHNQLAAERPRTTTSPRKVRLQRPCEARRAHLPIFEGGGPSR